MVTRSAGQSVSQSVKKRLLAVAAVAVGRGDWAGRCSFRRPSMAKEGEQKGRRGWEKPARYTGCSDTEEHGPTDPVPAMGNRVGKWMRWEVDGVG